LRKIMDFKGICQLPGPRSECLVDYS
jgi:hypothetical protein